MASVPSAEAMAILNSAACGLLQTDGDGNVRWVNQRFCDWVGCEAVALVGRRKIQDLFTVGGRIFHQTHWVPLMQMQGSVFEVKFDVVHANGHTVPMVVNGVRRRHGEIVIDDVAVFIARDRDKYERELVNTGKRLNELVVRATELEEIARDRATFAEQMMGIVSHDLRNPLATVELSALAMLGTDADGDHQVALARITRAASRATRLIHDLLDFTQARLGNGLSITRVDMELHAVMAESVDELRHAFPHRMLKHVSHGSGRCEADPDRLMQLVGNMVTNAITYGRGDSSVTITSRIDESGCVIAVHNEGDPIDDTLVNQLFRPMARGASAPDGNRSVGLGLYIVREIARAHGGDVTVTSSMERGTTFSAAFPCCAPP